MAVIRECPSLLLQQRRASFWRNFPLLNYCSSVCYNIFLLLSQEKTQVLSHIARAEKAKVSSVRTVRYGALVVHLNKQKIKYSRTSTNGHFSTTAKFLCPSGQFIHSLLFYLSTKAKATKVRSQQPTKPVHNDPYFYCVTGGLLLKIEQLFPVLIQMQILLRVSLGKTLIVRFRWGIQLVCFISRFMSSFYIYLLIKA